MSENQTTKFADKNLLDEEFLSAVLCDNAACQYVLRILLGVNDIVVKSVSDRVAVKNPQAPGEVVDVSGEDSRGFTWEIAVCRTDRVEPLHSRYEFARIVKRLEDNGEGYSDTREMAVVYIGAVDHYGKSQNIYTVRSYIKENGQTCRRWDKNYLCQWARTKDGFTTMRHCSCRGIMGAVYDNMGWNEEYKYRIIGSSCGSGDDAMLIFYLEEPMIIAPTKEKAQPKESRPAKEKSWVDDVMGVSDGWDQKTVSTIDPMDYVDDGRSAKSSAIYYGSIEEAAREGRLNLEQLGKDKYDPSVICEMVKKGLSPQEGWVYLRGMAVFKKNSIMIFPEDWADSFGTDIYHSCTRKQARYEHGASGSKPEPYGWTLGVDVPTREEVDEEIEKLKRESA